MEGIRRNEMERKGMGKQWKSTEDKKKKKYYRLVNQV